MTTMKMMIPATVLTISALAAGYAVAAAPQLHVTKSITINAPAAAVWRAAKDFSGLNTWHPAVAKDEIVEGENNTAGAVRLLTLKDGGTIKEKLLSFDDAGRTFKYSIVEGVLPVSDYTSTFAVTPAGKNRTLVSWSGRFKRKNLGEHPAENENDKTAVDAIGAVYTAGLDNLKKLVEEK
jgi:mxaD protein